MLISTLDFDFNLNISSDGKESYFYVTYYRNNTYNNNLLSQIWERLNIRKATDIFHRFKFRKLLFNPWYNPWTNKSLDSCLFDLHIERNFTRSNSSRVLSLSPSEINFTTSGPKLGVNISDQIWIRNKAQFVEINYDNLSRLRFSEFMKNKLCQIDCIMRDFWNENDFFYELSFISCTLTFVMKVLQTKSLVRAVRLKKLNDCWENFFSLFFVEYSSPTIESDKFYHTKRLRISENKNLFQSLIRLLNLNQYRNLEEIDFNLNEITDVDLAELILPKQLVRVDLSRNSIIKILNMSNLTGLKYLNLSLNKI